MARFVGPFGTGGGGGGGGVTLAQVQGEVRAGLDRLANAVIDLDNDPGLPAVVNGEPDVWRVIGTAPQTFGGQLLKPGMMLRPVVGTLAGGDAFAGNWEIWRDTPSDAILVDFIEFEFPTAAARIAETGHPVTAEDIAQNRLFLQLDTSPYGLWMPTGTPGAVVWQQIGGGSTGPIIAHEYPTEADRLAENAHAVTADDIANTRLFLQGDTTPKSMWIATGSTGAVVWEQVGGSSQTSKWQPVVGADTTLTEFGMIPVDTTTGTVALTFPDVTPGAGSPDDGYEIEIKDVGGAFNTNNATFVTQGTPQPTIDGQPSPFTAVNDSGRYRYRYDAATNNYDPIEIDVGTGQSYIHATLAGATLINPDQMVVIFGTEIADRDLEYDPVTGIISIREPGLRTFSVGLLADTAGIGPTWIEHSTDNGANWNKIFDLTTAPNNSSIQNTLNGYDFNANDQIRVVTNRSTSHVTLGTPVTLIADPVSSYIRSYGESASGISILAGSAVPLTPHRINDHIDADTVVTSLGTVPGRALGYNPTTLNFEPMGYIRSGSTLPDDSDGREGDQFERWGAPAGLNGLYTHDGNSWIQRFITA